MTAHAISQERLAGRRSPAALLRLAGDERLVALTRAGNEAAFEVIVSRYQARLLSFCARIVRSREDAEDVLQEVFAAAFNALRTDEREINLRPWLYRIARNRSLNQLRRHTAIGVDSMDVHCAEMGISTCDKVFRREDFKLLLGDIEHLPESQRTALLLREIEGLSYEQIAEVMDQTVSGIKSLLVRARLGLAEAGESRKLTCDQVRLALAEAAEGVGSLTAPIRRHVKSCERCAGFRKHLNANNRALAALAPFAPLLLVKQLLAGKVGASAGAGGAGATVGGGVAAGGTAAAGGSFGALTTTAVATKAVAAVAAAALLTAGTVAVTHHVASQPHVAAVASAGVSEQVTTTSVFPSAPAVVRHLKRHARFAPAAVALASATAPVAATAVTPAPVSEQVTTTTVFPAGASGTTGATTSVSATSAPTTPPASAPPTSTPSTATAPGGGDGAAGATTGTTGASGPTSASGPVGSTGQSGATGQTGASGSSGSSGSSGTTGGSGTSGATGATGGG